MLCSVLSRSFLIICLGWCLAASAASPPSEKLFPSSTKGWVSFPDIDKLRNNFRLTQLGELIADEAMQPFMEDLGQQFEEKLNEAGVRLGLKFADLDGIYGGEVAAALIRADAKDINSHALAMVVDITGKRPAADALLARIEKNMAAKGGKKSIKKAGARTLTYYVLPKKAGQNIPPVVIYAIDGDTLVASDHEGVIVGILGRIDEKGADSLANVPSFQHVAEKVFEKNDPLASNVRWFVEPLGYAEAARAANGGKTKRGADKLAILRKQGFGALQGIGGRVELHDGKHEILHQSFAYAPPAKDAKAGDKYTRSANMLDFPNGKNLDVQSWVPAGVSSYVTFNWRLPKAFEHFGSLFDAFTEEGTWEEILAGLEQDPSGPEINVKQELINNLGERVTLISDYHLPIDPKCERIIVAVELNAHVKDVEKKALEAIRKLMKAEAGAHKTEIEGHEVWEVSEQADDAEIPTLNIDGPGQKSEDEGSTKEGDKDAPVGGAAPLAGKPISWVVTVANGHIFAGTHTDLLAEVLKKKDNDNQLAHSTDQKEVRDALRELGSDDDSFRFFTRTDEAYRPTYELLKKGQMPEAETMLGRLLNQAFPPTKRGAMRKQEIDGGKLPKFEKVAPYLGPVGAYIQSEKDGWLVKGCLLKKVADGDKKKPAEVAAQPKEDEDKE